MSRAFVKEDAGEGDNSGRRYSLPPRDDPGYLDASAWALLDGANVGDSMGAEAATGYRWGDPALKPAVERILEHARARGNDRLEQLAVRFLQA